jgi:hypothetical protein
MFFGLDSDKEYYLYQRESEAAGERRDHIVTGGISLCSYCVKVPESVSPTHLDEITVDEWSTLIDSDSNLCAECRKKIAYSEYVPEEYRKERSKSSIQYKDDIVPDEGCHIYYRQASSTSSPSDHIIEDGETLCNYNVNLTGSGTIKAVEEVSMAEWSLIFGQSSNLCRECMELAQWGTHMPMQEDIPDEEPQYQCPYCDEPALKVKLEHLAYVWHDSLVPTRGTIHKVSREHYEQWRRNPMSEQS